MKTLFHILIFVGFCFAKLLLPINNPEIEILDIKGKNREYFISRGSDLKYEIEGPKLVVLNSRRPIPKRYNEKVNIEFSIHLEGSEKVSHKGSYDLTNLVHSKKHPAHAYTESGQIYINIPTGSHVLNIRSQKDPVLFRLTTKKKPKRKKTDSVLSTNCGELIITTGKKFKEYSIIQSQNAGIFNLNDEKLLWLYIRGIHNNDELKPITLNYTPPQADFQKIIFYSEPSSITSAEGIENKIGKLRTFPIPLSDGFNELIIENLSDMDVLIHGGFVPKSE